MKLPKIGQEIEVTSLTDETGDKAYLELSGTVVYFDYLCGCGQSPGDPMIGVLFEDGKIEEFWKEEIT